MIKINLKLKKYLELEIKGDRVLAITLDKLLNSLEIRTLLVGEVLFISLFLYDIGWQFFWINGSEIEENKIIIKGFNLSYKKEVFNYEVNLPDGFIDKIKNKTPKLKSNDFKEKIKFLKKEYNPYTLADICTNRYVLHKDLDYEKYCIKDNSKSLIKDIRKIDCDVIHFDLTKAYDKYSSIVGDKITLLIGIEDFSFDNEVIDPAIYQYSTIIKAKSGTGTLKTFSGLKPFYGFALFIDLDEKYKRLIRNKLNKKMLELEKSIQL